MYFAFVIIPTLILLAAAAGAYFVGKITHRRLVKTDSRHPSVIVTLVVILSFLVLSISLYVLYLIQLDFSR